MIGKLDGKVAIITGVGAGLGRALALLFAKEGAIIVGASRNTAGSGEESIEMLEGTGCEAIFIKTDISRVGDVRNLISITVGRYRHLDVLINNAAIQGDVNLTTDLREDIYDRFVDVNLKGVWLCMKYAIPEMRKTGGGSIVNISSICALLAQQGLAHYAATKGGVTAMSRVTAIEYAPYNIRVNVVCPGPIAEEQKKSGFRTNPELVQVWKSNIPMGRFGKPDEIASLVLFLASDDSSYMTGSVIAIDGGITATSVIQSL